VQYTYTVRQLADRKVRKQTSHQNAAQNQKTDYPPVGGQVSGIFLYQG